MRCVLVGLGRAGVDYHQLGDAKPGDVLVDGAIVHGRHLPFHEAGELMSANWAGMHREADSPVDNPTYAVVTSPQFIGMLQKSSQKKLF